MNFEQKQNKTNSINSNSTPAVLNDYESHLENLKSILTIIKDNNLYCYDMVNIGISTLFESINSIDLRKFLPQCGDVESNPGPTQKECDANKYFRKMISKKIEDKKNTMKFNIPKELPINIKYNRRKLKKNIEAQIQMDSPLNCFNGITSEHIKDGIISSIPYVGTPIVANKYISKLTSKAENIMESVNTLLKSVNSMFDSFKSKFDFAWMSQLRHLFISLVNVYFARPNVKISSFILNLTNFAMDCGCDWSHFAKLFPLSKEGDCIDAQHQINLDEVKGYLAKSQLVASGLIVTLFSIAYKITGQHFKVDKAISFLGQLGKNLNGIKQLKSVLLETSDAVMKWFQGDMLGLQDAAALEKVIANIKGWFDEVRELLKRIDGKSTTDQILENPDKLMYVEELYKRGLEFSIEINQRKLSAETRFPFEQHMKLLTEYFKKCETSGAFGNKPRISPLIIWLYGSSGVGKSGVSWPLAIDLNNVIMSEARDEDRKNFVRHVYFRNVEQEFWDGYQGQNVVVYDDFGQMKDNNTQPNVEFMEIIRTANISPYPLHMAHLEEKRKTKFTSKVGILSSNEGTLNIMSLTHPDAVTRRIDIKAEVVVIPKFAETVHSAAAGKYVTRLNVEAVEKEFGDDVALVTQVYGFKIIDSDSNTPTGEILNYAQFRDRCKKLLYRRIHKSHNLNKYLEAYALGEHPDRDIPYPNVSQEFVTTVDEQASGVLDLEIQMNTSDYVFPNDGYEYTLVDSTDKVLEHILNNVDLYNLEGIRIPTNLLELPNFDTHEEIIEALYREHKHLFTRERKLITRLLRAKDIFVNKAMAHVKKLYTLIKENPLVSVCTVLGSITAGFILIGGYKWLFSENDNTGNINRKSEIPVNDTLFLKHFDKEKIKCAPHRNIYLSTATPQEVEEAKTMRQHFFIPSVKIEDNSVPKMESNQSGDNITRTKPIVLVESNQSGDNLTQKLPIVKLESNPSGDSITRSKPIIKVESNPSGDNLTRNKPVIKVEANPSGDNITRRSPTTRIEVDTIDAEIHMWKDTAAQLLITNRILGNMYRIIGVKENKTQELLNCLFIRGNIALVPAHLRSALHLFDTIVLINSFNVRYTIPTHALNFVNITDAMSRNKEASLMYVNSSYIHGHTDIVKHFTTSLDMGKWRAADIALPTLRYSATLGLMLPTVLGNSECYALDAAVDIRDSTKPEEMSRITLREGVTYQLNTRAGDCGSPLIVNENSVLRKICGIHNAGASDGKCYGESITQKDLHRALKEIPAQHQIKLDLDMFKGGLIDIDINDDAFLENYSKLVPGFKFNPGTICLKPPASVTKSDLRPSVISGVVTMPTTKPAYLKPTVIDGEYVDIKKKNLLKAAMDTPYISKDKIDSAVHPVRAKLLSHIRPELSRILTLEEAVQGSSDSDFLDPVNRSSSPGYPWILYRKSGMKGKQQWLGDDENYKLDPEVEQACIERVELAKRGLRAPTIWVDTLKDERRPIEKVNLGKTRVFANGPMDYTIVFRQYFLGFMAHVMENRILNEQSIGTNTWSRDWTRTAKYLQRHGNKVIAGDFQTFDGTLNSCIIGAFIDIINDFYDDGPENALIRRTLFSEVFNSIHLCEHMIYMWTHSQPSGCPITTVLNSFYNSVSMRIVFNDLANQYDPTKYNKFDEYCTMVSYGDDNVVNISDKIIYWFNQLTISDGYTNIGMIYTDEAKSGEMIEYRSIFDVKYLKRSFVFDNNLNLWKAPLDLDTIKEMINWIRGDLDKKASTLENCSNAIRELSQHPQNIFDEWTTKINKACLTHCKELPEQYTFADFWRNQLSEYFL